MGTKFVIDATEEAPDHVLGVYADIVEKVFNDSLRLDPDIQSNNPYLMVVQLYESLGDLSGAMLSVIDSEDETHIKQVHNELYKSLALLTVITNKLGAIPHDIKTIDTTNT